MARDPIVIQLRLSRGVLVLLACALVAVPVALFASSLSIPNAFSNGATADATAVNANFAAIATAHNDTDTRLGTVETSYLPKSGGTLTGAVTFPDGASQSAAFPFSLVSQNNPFGDGSQIAYLRFEGNYVDEMGTYGGAATGSPSFVTGRFGQALAISGTNGFASTANMALTGAAARTMTLWTKQNVMTQSDALGIAGWGTAGTGQLFVLTPTLASAQQWGYWSYGATDINSGVRPDLQWHFLAMTYDGTTQRLYLDGQYIGQSIAGLNTGTSKLTVASGPVGGPNAYVDSLRVFNRQLSGRELQALYFVGR